MSKERLEEIKKELELDWSDISYVVNQYDVKWLINRVEELEEREKIYKEIIQSYGKIADGFVDDIERLVKRNEHYKQALEEITQLGWSDDFGGGHNYMGEYHAQAIKISKKALEGEE